MINSIAYIISEYCNLNCPHCLSKAGVIGDNEITAEEMIEFMDKLSDLTSIRITGGEPLSPPVYGKTKKIIEYCLGRNMAIQLNTNGTFLLPPDFIEPSENLVFQVSLDGMKDRHDSFRGEGVFDKAISFIIDTKKRGYNLFINSVFNIPNWDEINNLISYVKTTLGVEIEFQMIQQVGRAENMETDIANYDSDVQKFSELGVYCKPRIEVCHSLLSEGGCRIGVDSEGNIIPCPFLIDYKLYTIKNFSEFKTKILMKSKLIGATCSHPLGRDAL